MKSLVKGKYVIYYLYNSTPTSIDATNKTSQTEFGMLLPVTLQLFVLLYENSSMDMVNTIFV